MLTRVGAVLPLSSSTHSGGAPEKATKCMQLIKPLRSRSEAGGLSGFGQKVMLRRNDLLVVPPSCSNLLACCCGCPMYISDQTLFVSVMFPGSAEYDRLSALRYACVLRSYVCY